MNTVFLSGAPPQLLLAAFVLAYLVGSIPWGVILTAALGMGDLRRIGSGNIGATNVLRTGNRGAALATLLLDAGKGAAAVMLARALVAPETAQVAALGAMLGHCFPVWLRFRGGKGVATFLGVLFALYWPLGVIACAIWLGTAVVSRYSSLSALLAASVTPIVAILLGGGRFALLLLLLLILIYWRHWPNIQRLRAGTEPRIGQS